MRANGVYAERVQVVEALGDAFQIADAVPLESWKLRG